jgi:UDP-N-acetylglucosamine--N-acetylmuramyl-(pentapeptide) pyrophosphoryl-undecaprenol N-acetylglucosamine transferase
MKVIIAGGGTGGHLFPGMAIAQEFLERDRDNKVLFIGTRRGIENRILRKEGYELRFIDIEGVLMY